eukprot:138425-Hanusia_phi.AAC.1
MRTIPAANQRKTTARHRLQERIILELGALAGKWKVRLNYQGWDKISGKHTEFTIRERIHRQGQDSLTILSQEIQNREQLAVGPGVARGVGLSKHAF